MDHSLVKELFYGGNSFLDMWMKFGLTVYSYDKNFRLVSKIVINSGIKQDYLKSFQKKKIEIRYLFRYILLAIPNKT